jgi:hypothetical protein
VVPVKIGNLTIERTTTKQPATGEPPVHLDIAVTPSAARPWTRVAIEKVTNLIADRALALADLNYNGPLTRHWNLYLQPDGTYRTAPDSDPGATRTTVHIAVRIAVKVIIGTHNPLTIPGAVLRAGLHEFVVNAAKDLFNRMFPPPPPSVTVPPPTTGPRLPRPAAPKPRPPRV